MTPTQLRLVARMERRAARGGKAPTRAEVAGLCKLARELDAPLPGHVARMIDVICERVSAGDDARATVEDYGWEWDRGPSLDVIVRLIALREAVRAHVRGEGHVDVTWKRVLRALKRAGGARRRT